MFILVHGRAGGFDAMWTFARCVPEGCHILAPQAHLCDPLGGWSWWPAVDFTVADIRQAMGRLDLFIEGVMSRHQLAPSRVIGFGFSQGAGLVSASLLAGRDRFDGLALLAGFVPRQERPASLAWKGRIFMAHGTCDQIIPIARAREDRAYLNALGLNVELHEDDVGHKVGANGMRALKLWSAEAIR